MKLVLALSLVLFAAPQDPDPTDPVELEGKCCVPAYYVAPPPPASCPTTAAACRRPDCSGSGQSSFGGLSCIPDFGECDEEMQTLIYLTSTIRFERV